jgi:hypothetical protein
MNDEFTRVKLWKQTWEDFPKTPFSFWDRKGWEIEKRDAGKVAVVRAKIKLNYE